MLNSEKAAIGLVLFASGGSPPNTFIAVSSLLHGILFVEVCELEGSSWGSCSLCHALWCFSLVIVRNCRPPQLTMLQGVANRDIKLENILLDGSEPRPLIKISDFGYSKVVPA